MHKKWFVIGGHVLFWVFSSWLIIYSFSITEHFVEVHDGVLTGKTKHGDDLIRFFAIGQPIFALYFYLQFYFTQKLTNSAHLKNVLKKLVVTMLLFLGAYFLTVKFFFFNFMHILWFPSLWYGIFIFYTVVAVAYGLMKAWTAMESDKKNLELINKQTELHLLRSQLHPHFLFNTMNNLLSMVDQVSHPKLAKSIDTLSGLLRYVVYENKSDVVPISKEIAFIQDFSELHLLRFEEDEIDYSFNITGSNNAQFIEKGILLSFVENAFKHGVQPEFNTSIAMDMDITTATKVIFNIQNSIPPKIGVKHVGGYGLKATKERLRLRYPNKHLLVIEETAQHFNVTLTIHTDESNNR